MTRLTDETCRCPQCEGTAPEPKYKTVREAFAEFFYMVDNDDEPYIPEVKPLPGGAPSAHDFGDVPF